MMKKKIDKKEFWKGLGYSKKIQQLNGKAKNLAPRIHERDQVKNHRLRNLIWICQQGEVKQF